MTEERGAIWRRYNNLAMVCSVGISCISIVLSYLFASRMATRESILALVILAIVLILLAIWFDWRSYHN